MWYTATMSIQLRTPLGKDVISELKIGDQLLLSGTIYTARDAAHKKIAQLIKQGSPLPFNLKNQVVYYVGPTPAAGDRPIGSAGPTTSDRMDPFTPLLFQHGLAAVIGKGPRSEQVKQSFVQYCGLYLGAIGGAGALLSKSVKSAKIIAFPELGTEAVRELEVVDFPVVVLNDSHGGDLYSSR